jgi:tRNA U34 5-methylaminomethyl-2-thiouridine-forming methyltransferase MnmC
MQSLRVISTADGSSSVLNIRLNETYHSTHGAIQESQFIFIDRGLDFVVQLQKLQEVKILEIGFGTGLNALLSLHYAEASKKNIYFETLEAYPIDESVWSKLNYPTKTKDKKGLQELHLANWEEPKKISTHFSLHKREGLLQETLFRENHFVVVFFDAFAPATQPELWEKEMLSKVVHALVPSGVFITYCAKGQLKRDLKALGMTVEKLAGPPGKREIIRGIKNKVDLGS